MAGRTIGGAHARSVRVHPSTAEGARSGSAPAASSPSPRTRGVVLVACAGLLASLLVLLAPARAEALPVGTATVMARGIRGPRGIAAGPDGNLWFANTAADSIGRISPAGAVTIFSDPGLTGPSDITAGPDGNLWFTNSYADAVGRITPAGVITLFSHPSISAPQGIVAGPDGNLWFTNLSTIGRITPAGVVTSFTGTGVATPSDIAVGPDGNLWFTNSVYGAGSVGRITPAGVVSNFTGTGVSWPQGIAAGPDGALWFANTSNNSIGRITTAGVVSNFTGAGVDRPKGITPGPDGALWFTNSSLNPGTIGRITTAGAVSTYNGSGVNAPLGITAGPDGNLWFANESGNSIGRITPAGFVTDFVGNGVQAPTGITSGPDGNLWFTNTTYGAGAIGRITPAGVTSYFAGGGVKEPTSITGGPDGNLWFTNGGITSPGSIGRITTSGVVTIFTDASISGPTSIAAGSDGNLWFSSNASCGGACPTGSIGRITPTGTVTSFTGPDLKYPRALRAGPDGNLWFVVNGPSSPVIGRITTAGVVSTFSDPAIYFPVQLAAGPDGNVWFTNSNNTIGRITPAGAVTSFSAVGINIPRAIAAGPDGNVWFSNAGSFMGPSTTNGTVGRITPAGAVTTFPGNGLSYAYGMIAGPDGNVWVTSGNAAIVRVSVATTPSAPTAVIATPGNAQATVSWTAPASTGGAAVTGYTVTAAPGGASCTWTSGPLSCVVPGLTNGSAYTVTVTATNSAGTGPASAPSAPVTPAGPPGAPTGVTAVPANAQVAVSWAAPASNNGAAITTYTVTSSPGGKTCTWASGPLTCTVTGLTNGQAYTFSVTASNSAGTGPASVASSVVTPVSGSYFHPLPPTRILDSRGTNGNWNAKLVAGSPKVLTVTGGAAAVPGGVDAVVMNVTVTGASAGSFLTVYPAGGVVPGTSSLNFAAGETIPNLVTVKVGTNGQVAFANAVGSTDVIVDIVGYFDAVPADRYNAITPARILDSRTANGGWNAKLVAGAPRTLAVRGVGDVPASADAVVMNVTATGGTTNSFLTVYPTGGSVPTASNVNFAGGQTIPNLVTVKIGADGKVAFANALGAVDVIADVVGYFDPNSGDVFHAVTPARVLDSRTTVGGWNAKLVALAPRALTVTNVGGVPVGATAVIGNTTVTGGTANSFVTVYPAGQPVPVASNVNFAVGQTIPNLVAVKLGANGQISFANAAGAVDVIFDVDGYFTPT
jgi:streptogramin lyase